MDSQDSEFQCPYCRQFAETTLPLVDKAYVQTGKVLIAFRHLPLERVHPHALKAAEAAECAAAEGRFWPLHDTLFRNQSALEESKLIAYGRLAGLNETAFETCIAGTMTEKVRADALHARRLGIRETPTFLFGTITPDGRVRIVDRARGALDFAAVSAILDRILAAVAADKGGN